MQSKTAANPQDKTSADEAVPHIAIARHLLRLCAKGSNRPRGTLN
jgi:hypothetical protein